jgi:small neutral amino acid transporter SnatA (MarC family)
MRHLPFSIKSLSGCRRLFGRGMMLGLVVLLLSIILSATDFSQSALAESVDPIPHLAQVDSQELPQRRTGIENIAITASQTYLGNEFGAFNLFIIFFVTLGPLKVIPPFVQLTRNASQKLRWQLAVRSSALSTLVILLVVIIGQHMLRVWQIQPQALMIAGGILLSLVSLKLLLAQYDVQPQAAQSPEEPTLNLAITPLAFPTILPPFGIAIALTLMVVATKIGYHPGAVIGLLLLVMGLNLVGMLAARPIFKFIRPVTLRVLGFTLSVLQFALGIQFVLLGLEIQVMIIRILWQNS